MSASGKRLYSAAAEGISPPGAVASPSSLELGISNLHFNVDGTLIISISQVMPTTLWIWSAASMQPCAVLIQHAPIKAVSWHPQKAETFMMTCDHKEPVVYIWNLTTAMPSIVSVPTAVGSTKLEVAWMPGDGESAVVVRDTSTYAAGRLLGEGETMYFREFEGAEDNDAVQRAGTPQKNFDTSLFDQEPPSTNGKSSQRSLSTFDADDEIF